MNKIPSRGRVRREEPVAIRKVGHQKVCSCGLSLKDDEHPACQGCGALVCEKFDRYAPLSEFRNKMLCGYCWGAWLRLDSLLGKQATWEETKRPDIAIKKLLLREKLRVAR